MIRLHAFIMKPLSLLAAASLCLTLTSCASSKHGFDRLTATAPKEEAFRAELKKELSTINVGIEMTAAELADAMNRVLPKELYKSAPSSGGPATVVTKNGPVAVSIADNYLYLTVPVAVSMSYGMFETPPLTTKLKFKVSANVTPDWRIDAQVYYTGLTDNLAQEVKIGPLSVKPRATVESMTAPLQRTLSALVAKKLNEKVPLQAQVAKAWSEAQKPIRLDKSYDAWLVVTPREVLLYPLAARDNRVKVAVGLTSFADLVIGPEPAARSALPLPRLKLATGTDRRFRVAVNTDVFYKDLLKIATPLLLNKELGQDGRSVILKDLDIYGSGDHLLVKVETAGSVEGIFYLTCRPLFNPQTNVVSVQDLDFDMESRSLLLNSADWFLHDTFRSKIQEKLNLDLTQRLREAGELAGKSLARAKLADNVFLSGSVQELRLNDLVVRRDRISLGVYLEGETGIVFH
ncbi:DUF4403 family protein [Geomonas sp.]|uniref:DUF4403 family protein n=1 Tax=Geomonas sp. TaxID=2651584 RepID=UPI002B49359E|nr:DUF4403 family protein [Geomonas sp.]HJV33521.1 DUF4403 family protein [Geomonas sp.]